MILDYTKNIHGLSGLLKNDSVTFQETESQLVVEVTDTDPLLFLPQIKSNPYNLYKEAVISLEFLDAKEPYQTDIMQFLWALQSDTNPATFPYIDQPVIIKPEKQTVRFDLHSNPSWFRRGNIKFARFDLPESYRGRIRISEIGLR